MVRRIAVRKILTATRAIRTTYLVSIVSMLLSIIGIILYFVTESDIILMEALIWLVEAMSFGGLAIAFKIAASRALIYRTRYEVLRLESLAVLVTSFVALIVTILAILRNIVSSHAGLTPIKFSLYLFLSSAASLVLERIARKGLRRIGLRIVSIRAIAEKLSLDFVLELAGGIAIVLSNIVESSLIERIISVAMGFYVSYGVIGIAHEAIQHLIGITPHHVYREIRAKVLSSVRKATRYNKVRRLKIESYGTFYEIELWLEAPPGMTLGTAHRESMRIARRVVHEVPEVLRALVVFVPARRTNAPPRSMKRYARKRITSKDKGGEQYKNKDQ